MIDLSPSQKKTVAAGVTVLSFAVVMAFVLMVGWVLLKFIRFASPALTPVITGIFLSLLFKPYYEWIRGKVHNPTVSLLVILITVLFAGSILTTDEGLLALLSISSLVPYYTILYLCRDRLQQKFTFSIE